MTEEEHIARAMLLGMEFDREHMMYTPIGFWSRSGWDGCIDCETLEALPFNDSYTFGTWKAKRLSELRK